MADIAAADVTYTKQEGTQGACPSDPRFRAIFKVQFGDGALTYPSGGIPLTKGKLGCPTNIDELTIIDSDDSNGIVYKYDRENGKIRIYNPTASHAHDLLVKGGQIASTTNDIAHYATDILGKEAATDATIAGSASATKGGVISRSSSAGTEFTAASTAPAATTLYVSVVGF